MAEDENVNAVDGLEANDDLEMNVGKVFGSVQEARHFMKRYNDENACEFRCETNNHNSLVFKCKKRFERAYKGTGIRPKQHYNYLECKAFVRCYKTQARERIGELKITRLDLEHSHELDRILYDQENVKINPEEESMIKTLVANRGTRRQ